jgi:hypothetical protein
MTRITPHQVVRILNRAGFRGWQSPRRKPPGQPGFRVVETNGEMVLQYEALGHSGIEVSELVRTFADHLRDAGVAIVHRDVTVLIHGWPD